MKLGIVILAAGQGTRMKSSLPKVLHELAGKPLLRHVLDVAFELEPEKVVVVYGHGGESVPLSINEPNVIWVEQAEQLGTGHAVQHTLPHLESLDRVLVLYGDVPLIKRSSLDKLLSLSDSGIQLLTLNKTAPFGYGRIVRNQRNDVVAIVEQKDANPEQAQINEVNTGILSAPVEKLEGWLSRLSNENKQGEYYLTDIISMSVADGLPVVTTQPHDTYEAEGINDRAQLAKLERVYQKEKAHDLMLAGITLRDPDRFDIRGSLDHGQDVEIDINVLIEGKVSLGNRVSIGANTLLRNVSIADGVTILENCVIEDASIGAESRVGPFSRIRPGTELVGKAHVGNFVEIKKAKIGYGTKVNHLAYVGDSELGEAVNVGAGTITCNYDGANKHKTIIGDRAFIGSNTALVAPVVVEDDATIGAGSVIAKDAPSGKLTLARAKQVTLNNWRRPVKKAK